MVDRVSPIGGTIPLLGDARRGQLAAQSMVQHLLDRSSAITEPIFGARRDSGHDPEESVGEPPGRQLRRQTGQLVDLLANAAKSAMNDLPLTTTGRSTADAVMIGPVPAGTSGDAELWLHHWSSPGEPVLHTGDLQGHEGGLIPAAGVRLTFGEPDADRPSSIRFTLHVDVPHDAASDLYRGMILVGGHTTGRLAIELRVGDDVTAR